MNEYATSHGSSLEVFLVTQYFINGYKEGIDNDLRGIRERRYKYSFDLDTNELCVNGNRYELPTGWMDREKAYNNAKDSLK